MQFKIPHRRNLLCTAVSLSLLPLAGVSFAQDDSVEEVLVTGSFIRRSEGFTSSSQVTQLSAADLEGQGTMNMGEVIQNLSFVNGAASAITNTIQGTSSRNQSIDLRGLGASSTLTLMDGKRLVNENVQALIPTIAIQRLDIVADGAAALYGSEAVAGVVNFIPYKSFDGLRIDTFAEGDAQGDFDSHQIQAIWGTEIGGIDIVVAGSYENQTRLGWDERSDLANSGLVFSNNAPGNWFSPGRDADGQYTGTRSNSVDPNCGTAAGRTDYTAGVTNNALGMRLGSSCWFDFGDTRSYFEPEQDTKLYANLNYDVNDDLTLSAQGFLSRLYQTRHESTSNPGNSRIGELPSVRGEIPGNPFRAVTSAGTPLFGVDANGDGIPDRGTQDLNNDGTFDAIVSGVANNGIPLFEDVQARTLRPINKTHTFPVGFGTDGDNIQDDVDHISRVTFQADFNVPMLDGWRGMAAWTHNYREQRFMSGQNYDIEAMKQGLNCDVVNDRESCYNPFFVVDQANNNSQQVMDAISARDKETVEDQLTTIDIVLNGEIAPGGFELPGGPIGAAVGYQFRDDKFTNTPSAVELAGDTWIGGTEQETVTTGAREVDAYFAEVAFPILSNLELTAAVRRETFSSGQESTDPKFGVTYAPTEWLTLRGTTGDAFIAPSLEDLFNPVTCGLSTVTDRFGPFSAFTTACGGGNSTLKNETAESMQFGFDLNFDNWDVALTWNNTEFQNRIITIGGQDKMELDFQNFQQATGFGGTGLTGNQPTEAQLRAWLTNPASDKDIIRADSDIYNILQVNNTSTTNAESVEITAYDMQANYRFSVGDYGDFRLNLQATYIDEFLYQGDPTQPIRDGAGNYNDLTAAAPSLPKLRANMTVNWTRNNHSINAITRYDSKIDNYDGPLFTFMDFFGGTNRPGNITETGVKAWSQMDILYSYRGLSMFDGEATVTIGSRNVFDREPQNSPEFAGILGALQDPRGRMIYGRLTYDF
jgi:iron complex outermembrane receptor protein